MAPSIWRSALLLLAALGVFSVVGTQAPAKSLATNAPANASSAEAMANQVVVVTGAQRGIGLALTRELLAQGAQVIAGHSPQGDLKELRAVGRAYGQALSILPLDVTKDASVKSFVKSINAPAIDALINNAGVNVDEKYRLDTLPLDRLRQSFEVNTIGPVRMTQNLLPKLKAAKRPVVANISSVMGSIGENGIGGTDAYRMSKAALNMFTRGLAIEQPQLIVLALHPGWVKTQMGGDRAEITVEQSAAALVARVRMATPSDSGRFLRTSGESIAW